MCKGFPDSSVGKESTCKAGDPGSIPGLGRSSEDRIGYPPQYSWASLVAQLVTNPPAMRETWVWSLVWEDPLEKGKANHSSILAWRIPWTFWSMGSQRVRHYWATFTSQQILIVLFLQWAGWTGTMTPVVSPFKSWQNLEKKGLTEKQYLKFNYCLSVGKKNSSRKVTVWWFETVSRCVLLF